MKVNAPLPLCTALNLREDDTATSWLKRLQETLTRLPIVRVEPSTTLITLNGIDDPTLPTALARVINGDALATVIPGAYPKEACASFRQAVDSGVNGEFIGYEVEPDLERVELPLYEAASSNRLTEYFEHAFASTWAIQKAMYPTMAPTTLIRIMLDNAWPAGAQLLRIGGKKAPFGINRRVHPGGELGVHGDMSNWDLPVEEFENAMTSLSFLVYASDFQGGEVELWPDTLNDKQIYEAFTSSKSYALDRRRIGEPAVTIKPNEGDAVIFDARRLHGVRPVREGTARYTASGFINVMSLDDPLGLYH